MSAGGRVIASLPRKTETSSEVSGETREEEEEEEGQKEVEVPTTCINRIRTFDRNFHYVRIWETILRRRENVSPFGVARKQYFPTDSIMRDAGEGTKVPDFKLLYFSRVAIPSKKLLNQTQLNLW